MIHHFAGPSGKSWFRYIAAMPHNVTVLDEESEEANVPLGDLLAFVKEMERRRLIGEPENAANREIITAAVNNARLRAEANERLAYELWRETPFSLAVCRECVLTGAPIEIVREALKLDAAGICEAVYALRIWLALTRKEIPD